MSSFGAEMEVLRDVDDGRGSRQWYAIRIKSKFEKLAAASLHGKGFEEFLPLYRSKRCWSDRVKTLDLPLFPGYLFCRFDAHDDWLPILNTPGVVSIVACGNTLVPVSEAEIATIQAVLRSGLLALPWPNLTIGSHVVIDRGPLAGIEGIALDVDRKYRLLVSVSLLQRSVAVEIDREWARPILGGTGREQLGSSSLPIPFRRSGEVLTHLNRSCR